MTIDGMNQIPENTNYGPPNGYIPSNFMNGSWRDPSHLINNAWTQPQLHHANSWKPPDCNTLTSMTIPPPVAECVILDQDPHQLGMELPPPPPPPFIASAFNAAVTIPQFNSPQGFYFFNPPNQNIIHQPPPSVSESSCPTSSPPINPNEEVDMSISSGTGRSTPDNNLNNVWPFEAQPVEYVVEDQEQETTYKAYEGESVAAQIINCPEPYIPAMLPAVKRQTERRERHRSRSRSPRRRKSISPVRESRSDKRRESSSKRRKESDRVVERRRKDSDRVVEKSKEKGSSARRRRSPSISKRHDREHDRHVSRHERESDRRKEKSPSRRSHHRSRHSASPKLRRSISPKKSRIGSSRRRSESVTRENDKQQSSGNAKETLNIVDVQLKEYAQKFDPDAMLKKLKQNMMAKLKQTVMDPQPDTVSETDSSDNNKSIRLYYDTQPTGEKAGIQNGEGSEYAIPDNIQEDDSDESSEDEEIYPWYKNAPIQHEIGRKFLELKKTGFSCIGRPQKDKEENGIERTFPKRVKVYVPSSNVLSPRNDGKAPLNKNANIVKDAGSGFIVRRNGAMSWVSKTLMSNADAANMNANAQQSPNSNFIKNKSIQIINGQRITPDSNECFEYLKTKICQAGALCKYNHNGHNEHQKIKFCQKYMSGLCRNGDRCKNGSHSLLSHQTPVCGYYLRGSCPYLKGCQFLHVKHSAKTPLCIHFNKGKCLAEFPCIFIHRYCPTLIHARSSNGNGEERPVTEEESTINNLDDIPRLQWFED